jgi:hypothetical protein
MRRRQRKTIRRGGTTVQELNVLDFGVTGDGVTDDTDAIQAAVDVAAEINDRSTWSTAEEQVLQGARAFLAPHLKIARALVGSDNLRDQITTLVALQLATLDQSAFSAQVLDALSREPAQPAESQYQDSETAGAFALDETLS